MSDRPTWTVSGAAKACGVARSTIQRALKSGKLDGATEGPNGWEIPTESLLAAGFALQAMGSSATPSEHAAATPEHYTPLHPDELQELRDQVTSLQHALQLAHTREHAAQAVAEERERTIKAQELALRQLMPPETENEASSTEKSTPTESPMSPPTNVHKPRWTQRVRRRMGF